MKSLGNNIAVDTHRWSEPDPKPGWRPGLKFKVLALFDSTSIFSRMNNRQRRTLAAVFTDPVPASIEWTDIESLLVAVGCEVIEGNGSRVRFNYEGTIAAFHRPHPAKEAKKYQVKDAREFLSKIGVKP